MCGVVLEVGCLPEAREEICKSRNVNFRRSRLGDADLFFRQSFSCNAHLEILAKEIVGCASAVLKIPQ